MTSSLIVVIVFVVVVVVNVVVLVVVNVVVVVAVVVILHDVVVVVDDAMFVVVVLVAVDAGTNFVIHEKFRIRSRAWAAENISRKFQSGKKFRRRRRRSVDLRKRKAIATFLQVYTEERIFVIFPD